MSAALVQAGLVCAAFWVALAGYGLRERDPALRRRALAGLLLGAVAAHAGWALLHPDARVRAGFRSGDRIPGASVLFVPFGLLAAAPARRDPRRTRHLAGCFTPLPLALAVARAGCVVRGCCHGLPAPPPWGVALPGLSTPTLPVALLEIAGLLALFAVARRLPPSRVAPTVLAALGLLRLALEPLRAREPPAVVPVPLVALALVAAGLALALRR